MKALTVAIIITSVDSLERYHRRNANDDVILNKIIELLSNSKSVIARRAVDFANRKRSRERNQNQELNGFFRSGGSKEEFGDRQAALMENELQNALSGKKSALLDHPYVEHKGKNDFLVMKPDMADPFVTVVPNSIYYNVEKKCANWLDDCSVQGIRARLLRGVLSPYR